MCSMHIRSHKLDKDELVHAGGSRMRLSQSYHSRE